MSEDPGFELGFLVVARAGDLWIRRKHESDFRDDYAWRRDPELARFDGRRAIDITFDEYVHEAAHEARYASPWRETFSIVDAAGRHVGNTMFYNVTANGDCAELGVMLADPASWGQGSGRRVMVSFVRYLWAAHPFRTLVLHTLEWNQRALRCFQRAGFHETARVLRDEDWLVRMEARREWWLLWDSEGRFEERARLTAQPPA